MGVAAHERVAGLAALVLGTRLLAEPEAQLGGYRWGYWRDGPCPRSSKIVQVRPEIDPRRLAQARGLRSDNPAEPVHEVLPAKKPGRMPALLTFPALGAVLRGAEAAHLSPAVRIAHRLTTFTVARISNIVEASQFWRSHWGLSVRTWPLCSMWPTSLTAWRSCIRRRVVTPTPSRLLLGRG